MQITMRKNATLVPLMYLLPAVLLVVVFVYYPVVENIRLSFFRWSAFSTEDVWVGLKNYQGLMKDPIFWTGIRNNVAYAIASVVFQVGGAMVLAAILEEAFVRRF